MRAVRRSVFFGGRSGIRYQPDERAPTAVTLGLGLQFAVFNAAGIVLIPTTVIRIAGGSEAYLSWAVFVAVAVAGAITALQAIRVGRLGAGHVLLTGASGAFIAVCVTALAEGGPAMLATLVLVSSAFQFAISAWLSRLRRVLTPMISGTVIMLVPVTVMPIILDLVNEAPDGVPASAAPLSALATVCVLVGIALTAGGAFRLAAPLVGVAAGSVVAGYFGLYDVDRVAQASWIGLPGIGGWPGLELDLGPAFWALLPAFLLLTLIGSMETLGASAAIQGVSWRQRRAVDSRVLQGAVAADATSNLLSGLAGTVPHTTYATSVSLTEITGVAARGVGIATGVCFVALAFSPKMLAVALAVPGPVIAAYVAVLMAILFLHGIKMVVQHAGSDHRKGLIAVVAFWIGVCCQFGLIFPDRISGFLGGMLESGVVTGGLAAILLTLFVELTAPRRRRLEIELELSMLPRVWEFLKAFSSRSGWDAAMANRLEASSEETLLTLLGQDDADAGDGRRRRLVLLARREDGGAVLEFIAGAGGDNLQDRIALLGDEAASAPVEREVSLRLLRHFASSVLHQQYHDMDVVTVRVDVPTDPLRPGSNPERTAQ